MGNMLSVRTSDFEELARHPERASEGVTLVPGLSTSTFVAPLSFLQDLANDPDPRQRLADLADALIEEEYAYAMTVLTERDTGIYNTLWFLPAPGIQHGPRVKVMINPARTSRPGGRQATVPFDRNKPAEGDISPALERQVRDWIDLNRDALTKAWNLEYEGTSDFLDALKPLPKQ
jgi:hypothetical protein